MSPTRCTAIPPSTKGGTFRTTRIGATVETIRTPSRFRDDSYFVMGDNRDDSADSRYFGFLPRSHIVGRPLVVFWSYEDSSDAYLKTSIPDMLGLYLERIVFFVTRTRWSRMGHVVS